MKILHILTPFLLITDVIFGKYSLALMLHLADMIASYEENVIVDVEQYIDQRVKELVQNNESNRQESIK